MAVCSVKYMPTVPQQGVGEGDGVDTLYLPKFFDTFLTSKYYSYIM